MNKLKYVGYIIVGNFLLALSVYAFVVPFDITVGGATGLSIVLNKLSGINLSMIVLIINLICLPLGYFFVGKELVIGSLLSSLIYPLTLSICEQMTFLKEISDTILLASLLGGAVAGIGIGLVIKVGASTGGMDIPPIIINKKTRIPVNQAMYAIDTAIMLAQLPFCPINRVVYGIIYAYVLSYAMNKVLTYGVYKLQVNVITKNDKELCEALLKHDFGVTMNYIQTGLEKNEQKAIQTIVFSKNMREVQKIIDSIDEKAFVTIQEIRDVKGRGFTMEKEYKN